MEPVKRSADIDGCSCLRCRTVDVRIRRRSPAGDILWATTLLRRYPSVLVLAILIMASTWLLWPLFETMPQTWPIGTGVAFFIAVNATITRTYTVGVTVDALRGIDRPVPRRFIACQRYLPAVVVSLIATLLAAGVAVVVTALFVRVLMSALSLFDALAGVTPVVKSAFEGASASLVFGSVAGLGVYKFWLAPEICVAGGYGPLTALRVSWQTTRLHRFRILVVITGFAATMLLPEIGRRAVAALGGEWLLWDPLVGLLQLICFGVGYVVWYAVGTQIYVRTILSGDGQNRF